jgi:hypothetical protein
MKTGRNTALLLVALMVLSGGCRNPFNPDARIRFDRFYAGTTGLPILTIQQNQASTLKNSIATVGQIQCQVALSNKSTVPGRITGYNVVYRQLSTGLPIPSCGGAAGRRFQTHFIVTALGSNYSTAQDAVIPRYVEMVTDELLTHIATDLSTVDGGIDCEVTFYGEDDNGYDIKVEGVLHIDVL